MTDDAGEASLDPEIPQTDDASEKPPEKMDPAFYAALALVGILVLLIVVINVPGIRASAGITLTRSDWTLQSYADVTGGLVPVLDGTKVTARFGTDGTMSGSAGCNQYAATYTTRDFAITISPPVTTLMYCENPDVMQQESDYINDLAKSVGLRISESTLNLYDTTGKPLLVFKVMR
ncbi:MAG TPA: META domain-containing protein [Methanoregula sp.]|nr:META domain-containing protein [Methanoregula sp.]